jgi:hypothetical protein
MKNPLPLFFGCFLAVLFLFTGSAVHAQAKWTFMVYLDADNNLEPFGIIDFNEMEKVGSTNDVNIIVQMDRAPGYDNSNGNWTGTKRFRVTQDANTSTISSTEIQDLGEVNMGDPNSLVSFIQWASTNYPATNYALVLWDHGGGWQKKATFGPRQIAPGIKKDILSSLYKSLPYKPFVSSNPIQITGVPGTKIFPPALRNLQRSTLSPSNILKNVCSDETNGDILYNHEVSSSIDAAGLHLNLIGFDACLMAMLENAYPLRNLGDYMVGSEETEPADGWPYDLILNDLKNAPETTPADLAISIVQKYGQFYNTSSEPTTLSAINLTSIANVASKLDAFTQAITANNNLWNEVDQVRSEADKFYIPEHKDLWHVADRMLQLSADATVDAAASDLKTAITDCVIGSHASSPKFANSKGLAIYFPDATNYDAHYGEAANGIDFMQQSDWVDFLISFFNGGGGGTGDPEIDYGADIYEPNNNLALAYGPVKNDKDYKGYLLDDSDVDLYRLEIPSSSNISINLDVPVDYDLYLIQPNGSDFSVLGSSEQSDNTSEGLQGTIEPGVYYLAVTPFDISTDPYSLTVTGIAQSSEPVLYTTTLAYDLGDPQYYIWGTALGDAAACLYSLPSVPARLNKIWFNIQNLDAGGNGGDGTFYLYATDYYGDLLSDTVRMLTPPDTGWLYLDLAPENIYVNGDFLLAFMYDGTNTPGIGYDTTKSFGNNLFFSTDYADGYQEDPGTYFIRAEVEYYVSNLTTGIRNVLLDPSAVTMFPNPFRDNAQVQYLLKQPGDVEIYVTDMQGRAVSKQILKNQPAGQGTYRLNGTDLSPGIYTVTLKIDGQTIQKKMVRH